MERDLDKKLVPIGQAADFLGVSIDTVRRWDEKGILHSERPDGKDRYFSLSELEKVKFSQPLSISEAAQKLDISETTLRRLEEKGLIKPDRNGAGERVYTIECLENFIKSDYYLRQEVIEGKILNDTKATQETKENYKEDLDHLREQHKVLNAQINEHNQHLRKLNIFRKVFYYSGVSLLTALVLLVVLFAILFIVNPGKTAKWFGYGSISAQAATEAKSLSGGNTAAFVPRTSSSLLSKMLQPIGGLSLEVVRRVSPTTYDSVIASQSISDVNDIFSVDSNGNIVSNYNLTFPNSSYLVIPDSNVVKNLNAQYVQGKAPGDNPGDLVTWSLGGAIDGLNIEATPKPTSVTSDKIADGAVTLNKIANIDANSILGNNSNSPASPVSLSAAQVKSLLALDQVDNVPDLSKPISALMKSTLDLKVPNTTEVNGHALTGNIDLDTSDIADSLNKRYVTDAQIVIVNNQSGVNTGDETNSSLKVKLGAASATNDGYLAASDWSTFNSKQDHLTSGSNIKTINSGSVLGSGDIALQTPLTEGVDYLNKTHLDSTYDAKGSATTAETNAKSYADGLAVNYDPAGSASTALSSANGYTNSSISALSSVYLGISATAADSAKLNGQSASYYQTALGFTPVPNTTTVNGHALSGNITVSKSDVGLGSVTNDAQVVSVSISSSNGFTGSSSGGQNPIITLNVDASHYLPTTTDQSTWNGKEPAVATGTTGQYYRGDKSWATLNASAVGLGNVDNTSDVNKPVSTATQTALGLKVDKTTTVNGYALSGNITLAKSDVGLGNVDNTSDANKPVSTATQTALGLKADKTTTVNGHSLSANVTVSASDLGLGNVENTALSTWAGTSNITTVGTVSSGIWHGTAIGDSYISSAATWSGKQNAYTNLSSIGALVNGSGWLHNDGAGSFAYSTPSKSDVGLGSVENTALSTWSGTNNITTVGTISSGTWSGTTIADAKIASALTGKTYNALTLTAQASGFTIAGGTASKTLTVAADASVSGTNTGDQTLAGLGGVATTRSLTINGTAYDLSADRTWTITNISGNAGTVTGLSVTSGKTLTAQNSLTLSGTDGSTLAIGTGGTLGTAAYTASSAYQAANSNLSSVSNLSYGSTTAFVKMTGANTFALDTNTYLTASSTLDASKLSGTIGSTVLGNSTVYIGTTAIALNRASASQALTGITSIDGNAATVTTNANLTGVITSVGNATSIASQTGTGTKFVVDTSPVLITPTIGVATATSIAIGGNTLDTNEWAYLDSTDQAIRTTSNVTFNSLVLNNFAGNGVIATSPTITTASNAILLNFQPTWNATNSSAIKDGLYVKNNVGASGVITNGLKDIHLVNPTITAGGSLDSHYGLYVDSFTGATTSYPIYLAGTSATGADNGIWWTTDTKLYRSAASTLKTDGALVVAGHATLEGITSTGATGTGKLVFDTAPTLGATTATSLAVTGASSSDASMYYNSTSGLVLRGKAGSSQDFYITNPGATTSILYVPTGTQNVFFNGHLAVEGVTSTGATGTGKFVFDTSPTLVTPTIGAATATSIAIGANALDTNEWANLDGQDQAVKTTSTPSFAGLGIGAYSNINLLTFSQALTGTTSTLSALRINSTITTTTALGFGMYIAPTFATTSGTGTGLGVAGTWAIPDTKISYGISVAETVTPSTSSSTRYGIYIASPVVSSGTLGNNQAIRIGDQTTGSVNHGIYFAGSGTGNDINWSGDTALYRSAAGTLHTTASSVIFQTGSTFQIGETGDTTLLTMYANGISFNRSNAASYINQAVAGGTIVFRTTTSTANDTTALTVSGNTLSVASLTSGRVTYAGTSGLLQDSSTFTYNGTGLSLTGASNAQLHVGGAAGLSLSGQNVTAPIYNDTNSYIYTTSSSGTSWPYTSADGHLVIQSRTSTTRDVFVETRNSSTKNNMFDFGSGTGALAGWVIQNGPQPSGTPNLTGGYMTDGTYYYEITAGNNHGVTLPGTESAAVTISGGSGSGSVSLTWTPIRGADKYNIYRTTTSGTYGATTLVASNVYGDRYTDTLATASLSSGTPATSSSAKTVALGAESAATYIAETVTEGVSAYNESKTALSGPAITAITSADGSYTHRAIYGTVASKVVAGTTNTSSEVGMRMDTFRAALSSNYVSMPDSGTVSGITSIQAAYGQYNTDYNSNPITTSMNGIVTGGSMYRGTVGTWTDFTISAPAALSAPSAWAANTSYANGTLVRPSVANGHYYVANGLTTTPSLSGGSTYAGGTTYGLNATVVYSNLGYVSLVAGNVGNQPDISPSQWARMFADYAAGTTYALGAKVVYSGVTYVSIQPGNIGNQPDTSATWWTASGACEPQWPVASYSYTFTVSGVSVNPSVGDTYTQNSLTYIVTAVNISAGSGTITAKASTVPSAKTGTLTRTAGAGDASVSYSTYTSTSVTVSENGTISWNDIIIPSVGTSYGMYVANRATNPVTAGNNYGIYFAGTGLTNGNGINWGADTNLFASNTAVLASQYAGNNTTGPSYDLQKTRGTYAVPAIINSGDTVGTYSFSAYDGTAFRTAAKIVAQVDATPGSSDMPGRLVFYTTPDGTITPTEAFRIDNTQKVWFGGGVAVDTNMYRWAANVLTTDDSLLVGDSTITATYHPDVTKLEAVGGNISAWNAGTLGAEINSTTNTTSDPTGSDSNAVNVGGWSSTNGTSSADNTATQTGSGYNLKFLATTGGSSRPNFTFTAVVGSMYKVSFWAKRGAQGTGQTIRSWSGVTTSPNVAVSSTTWTNYTFYVTANATSVILRMYSGDTTNDEIDIDNMSIKEVQGGDIIARGKFTGGNALGMRIDSTGLATFDNGISLGTTSLTMTGSIGATGARVTKGWFTDLESTNAITVGGVSVPTISSTNTLTNKRVTPRLGTISSNANPTINTDNVDIFTITAQLVDIASMTTNLSGTPTDGQTLHIAITGTAARAITWGTSFESSTVALPTTTVTTNRLDCEFVWNAATSKWRITRTY